MQNSQTTTFCNNCDKPGHNFHNCRKPLISSGIIAYRKRDDTKYEYLLICRRHTFGYIDFMRGRYAINNKSHLTDIIYEMTNKEKKLIMECNFEKCWLELWGSATNCYYKNEKTFAKEKFNMLMKGVHIKNEYYNTKTLIKESEALWVTPEWGFPKGRKNQYETNKDCALREWTEETGLPSDTVEIIENVLPYNEYVIGSNYQSYRDTYYIGKYKGEIDDVLSYQKIEISDARWATLEEIKSLIRPYHKERLAIIDRIDTVLRKWILA